MSASDRFISPFLFHVTGNSRVTPGGKYFFYLTGTSTLATTYSESTLTTENTNPVVADAAGLWGPIFLDPSVTYKVVLKDANDNTLGTADPVSTSNNGLVVLGPTQNVTLNVPAEYDTIQDALTAVGRWIIPAGATVTIQVTGHVSTTGRIALIDHPYGDRIKIRGTTALQRTLSSITAVSGTSRDFEVTGILNNGAGISVGDVIGIRDVIKAPGSYPGRPPAGHLQRGFYKMGYLTSSGSYTITGAADNGSGLIRLTVASTTGLTTGDVRRVSGVTGTTEANGLWTLTKVDATHIDLQGSTFANAYVSGGTIQPGVTLTGNATLATSFIGNGDIALIGADFRAISDIGAHSFTLSSDLTKNVSLNVAWQTLRAGAGTIEVSGPGTVAGTSTTFTTTANVGDVMVIVGYGAYLFETITDATNAKLSASLTIGPGAIYGVISTVECHETAGLVTAINVDGNANKITWESRSWKKPAINNTTTGTVKILTSVVTVADQGSGAVVQNGDLDMDHIAFVGSGGGALVSGNSIGIDLRGADKNSPDNSYSMGGRAKYAKLGPSTAIINFGNGALCNGPAYLFAQDAWFCGNDFVGVSLNFKGHVDANRAVMTGNGYWGLYLGPACSADFSDARLNGNGVFGLHMLDAMAGSYAEYPMSSWNGLRGAHFDGNVALHWNGIRMIANGESGLISDNGAYGRATESLVMCHPSSGYNFTRGIVECQQSSFISNGTSLLAGYAHVIANNSGFGHSATALRARMQGRITAQGSSVVSNTLGVQIEHSGCVVDLTDSGWTGNTTAYTVTKGMLELQGYSGTITPGSPSTLNQWNTGFGIASAGSDVATEPSFPKMILSSTGLRQTGNVSPSQITANQDNWNPGTGRYFRISSDGLATWGVSGLSVGQSDGEEITFINVAAPVIAFFHETTSTAANRLQTGGDTFFLRQYCSVTFRYSSTDSRWYLIATGGPPEPQGAPLTVNAGTSVTVFPLATRQLLISGTGQTINGFNSTRSGVVIEARFNGVNTLTHSSTFVLPAGGSNITTASGDSLRAISLGSSTWHVLSYTPASGAAVVAYPTASDTVPGIVELATNAETITGTDATRAVTPAGLIGSRALVTLTDAATIAVDMSAGNNFVVTLTDNRTMGNPSNTKVGQEGRIIINQDSGGSRTLTWSSNWEFAAGAAPTLTATASAKDIVTYFVQSATSIIVTDIVKAVS